MAREDVELALAGYAALARGDIAHVLSVVAPDFEVYDRTLPEVSPGLRGANALLTSLGQMRDAFEEIRYEPEEVIDIGDRLLIRVRASARARQSQVSVAGTMGHLWTLRDGKATRLDVYGDWEAAVEAAGLDRDASGGVGHRAAT